jgi:hypothetical protein
MAHIASKAAYARSLSWPALALVAPPLAVFLLTELAIALLLPAASGALQATSGAASYQELAARLNVLSVWLLLVASCAALVGFFAWSAWRGLDRHSLVRTAETFAACLAMILLVEYVAKSTGWLTSTTDMLTTKVPDFAGSARLSAQHLVDSTSIIIPLAAIAAVLGSIGVLATPVAGLSEPDWNARVRTLHVYLYLAAAMLVAGVLFHAVRLDWLGAGITDKASAAAFRQLVAAHAAYRGVQFSLLIASYFLPVALLLARARWGHCWLPDKILPRASALKAAIAIISPTLVGLVGQVAAALAQ